MLCRLLALHAPLYTNTCIVDCKSIGGTNVQTLAKHAKIGTNQVLEHFFDFSQPQEISDISIDHGYKIFIPFPFLPHE